MQQIRTLSKLQIEDPSILLDILMDLPSDGEVVEACLVNIGRSGAVSAFATEFIRYICTTPCCTVGHISILTPGLPTAWQSMSTVLRQQLMRPPDKQALGLVPACNVPASRLKLFAGGKQQTSVVARRARQSPRPLQLLHLLFLSLLQLLQLQMPHQQRIQTSFRRCPRLRRERRARPAKGRSLTALCLAFRTSLISLCLKGAMIMLRLVQMLHSAARSFFAV